MSLSNILEIKNIAQNVSYNEPMSKHTSFRIGGSADCMVTASGNDEICRVITYCRENNIKYIVMGNGTNMLVGDNGIRGVVIKIDSDMSEVTVDGEIIEAQSGILLSKLANVAMKNSLGGLEFAGGIPGTLGGGIFMNAGAYGGELCNVVQSVTYITADGKINTAYVDELNFGYRKSMFSVSDSIILSAVLKMQKANMGEIKTKMADFAKRRSDKQPLSMPSAGSTFKRPEGHFAGKLIEDSGLKGYSIGGAQVSEKHSGFIVNKGGATAKDVLDLIEYVKNTVKAEFGVTLEPEVRLVGEF